MSNQNEKTALIASLLIHQIESTNKIKASQKTLKSNQMFNPFALFILLDFEKKGFLTEQDLFQFAKSVEPSFRPEVIADSFQHLSKNGDRHLDYSGFAEAILLDFEYFSENKWQELKKGMIYTERYVGLDIRFDFLTLLKTIGSESFSLQPLKKQVRDTTTAYDFFEAIRVSKDEKIQIENLRTFLIPYSAFFGIIYLYNFSRC